MKKLLVLSLLLATVTVHADGHLDRRLAQPRSNGSNLGRWVAPAIVGGILGYSFGRSYTPVPSYEQDWTPYVPSDRSEPYQYRQAQPIYQETVKWDAGCNCYYRESHIVGWH